MLTRLYGFDWSSYTQHVMPAFARWLVEGDEEPIRTLYLQTRCAREEESLPTLLQPQNTWIRAQQRIAHLSRGTHALQEYRTLCSAEDFTHLSDHYLYRHPPRLYPDSDALRVLWGALLEQHCQPWFRLSTDEPTTATLPESAQPATDIASDEVIALLNEVGLTTLAQEVQEHAVGHDESVPTTEVLQHTEQTDNTVGTDSSRPGMEETAAHGRDESVPTTNKTNDLDDLDDLDKAEGVELGRHPATLHLRGWLAAHSIRAMVLFELLACGRRRMPFGYEAGEAFGGYIGYLTPDEVQHFSLLLRAIPLPDPQAAAEEHHRFRQQQQQVPVASQHMVDEVPPTHANALFNMVQAAALQGWGLLCHVG